MIQRTGESILYSFAMQGIVGAEGNYAPIRGGIMHAAPPQPLRVQVVCILKMHGSYE